MDLVTGRHSRALVRLLLASAAAGRLFPELSAELGALKVIVALAAASFGLGILPRVGALALAGLWLFGDLASLAQPMTLFDALSIPLSALSVAQSWAALPGSLAGVFLLLWFAFERGQSARVLQAGFFLVPLVSWAAAWNLPFAILALGMLPVATRPAFRPWAALGALAVAAPFLGAHGAGFEVYLLFGLASFGRAWAPPAKARHRAIVYFDAQCGLCARAITFLLAEDLNKRMLFCPLQSPKAASSLGAEVVRDAGPVVIKDSDRLLDRSAAVLRALSLLGGPWRAAAWTASLLPARRLDRAYDWAAKRRTRFFKRSKDLRDAGPDERSRFIG